MSAFWVATVNVRAGAFPDYSGKQDYPARLDAIRAAVAAMRAEMVGLIDTFRWKEIFSTKQLCELFGYSYAHHINICCDVVDPRIGLTVLGTEAVKHCEPVWIYDRYCLRVYLEVNGQTFVVYVTYLTSLSGKRRESQARALLAEIEASKDRRVLIMGDLNTVRPESMPPGIAPVARTLARLPGLQALGPIKEILELGHTGVIPILSRAGFIDELRQDPTPTFYKEFLGRKQTLRLDYILSRGLKLQNREVLTGEVYRRATDHLPVVVAI